MAQVWLRLAGEKEIVGCEDTRACAKTTTFPRLARSAADPIRHHRSMPTVRRFAPPWIVEEHNDACFIVKGTRPAAWRRTSLNCRNCCGGQRDAEQQNANRY
jgi:hypothetical protein